MVLHPLVAYRDCGSCRKWLYNEKTGKIETKNGRDVPRVGKPPCEVPLIGCAKGHYADPKTLSVRNWKAWQFYQECRAVGKFPDDDVVRHNARLIFETMEYAERCDRSQQFGQLSSLLMMTGMRNVR